MSKSTADVAMVGIALGPAAIAGVGYGLPFWMLAFILGGGIAGGTISLVSQRMGADDTRGVDAAITVSAVVAAGVTIPFAGLFALIPEPLIRIIGSGDQAIAYGADYLRLAGLSMPFAALNLVASRSFVGANDAQTPMIIRAGAAVGNVILNVPLIFVFDLGVVGAALGTLISNATATVFFAVGLLRGRLPWIGDLPLQLRRAAPIWNAGTARSLRRIATPLVFRNVALNGGEFPMLAIVSLFGPNAVAAFVVALRVRALMNTPGWGFGLASSSLVGQAMGTGDVRSTIGYAQDALRFTVATYAITAMLVFAFAGPISTVFVQDPDVLSITVLLVRATCASVVAWGLMNGALGPLRAAGDTRWPFYAQVFGLGVCALPVAYLGATTSIGFYGLYAALILETGVPAAVLYMRYRSGRWRSLALRS